MNNGFEEKADENSDFCKDMYLVFKRFFSKITGERRDLAEP